MDSQDATQRSQPEKSDKQLVWEIQAGCLAAFDALARRYQPRLLNYLNHRLGFRESAEDTLQETLLQVYRNVHQYNDRWQVSTWIFTICRNLASRAALKAVRSSTTELHQDAAILDMRAPSATTQQDEMRSELWRLVREHSTVTDFTMLWLFYVEQLPVDEVAKAINKTPAATKMALSRARAKLRVHLQSLNQEWADLLPQQQIRPTIERPARRVGS